MFHKVQGIQGACGNAIQAQDQGVLFGQWRRIHVQGIYEVFGGLRHRKETSRPYRPQQNGVAERTSLTIVEMARNMIHTQKLNKSFWVEAVMNAIYTRNRCPTRALERMTPEEA
jgi:transposase InsO family protein